MKKFVMVPIQHLMRNQEDFHSSEIFIRLSEEKYIKLTQKDDGYADTLERYSAKGLTDVYLEEEDFQNVFNKMQMKLKDPGPKGSAKEKMEILGDSLKMAKECLTHFGVNEEAIEVCKQVSDQAIRMVKEKGNLLKFFENFKNNCSGEFRISMMTSHLLSLMIDTFMWKSLSIKEKASMAAILCDVTLKQEDFDFLKNYKGSFDKLPEHILKHPLKVKEMLEAKKDMVSPETLTIIEQHHELPDGTGFPYKSTHQRITQLSALFIVARDFISRLDAVDFNYDKQKEILTELYNYYDVGTYAKAFESLMKVVNPSPNK